MRDLFWCWRPGPDALVNLGSRGGVEVDVPFGVGPAPLEALLTLPVLHLHHHYKVSRSHLPHPFQLPNPPGSVPLSHTRHDNIFLSDGKYRERYSLAERSGWRLRGHGGKGGFVMMKNHK